MSRKARRTIGAINIAAGLVSLTALIATYGLSEHLVAAQESASAGTLAQQRISPAWAPAVSVTLNMSLLLLGASAGMVGSVIQQSIVFASRAGYERLEEGFIWWYLLRPVWSALLGAVGVVAVNAGFVSIGDTTTSAAGVTVLAITGALAGLFTDQLLQRLQKLLGATEPTVPVTRTAMLPAVSDQNT